MFQQYQIKRQFKRPNWENRKPSTRPDIWRIMAVATFPDYEAAIKAYDSLVQLRNMRDISKKDEAMKYRPRNEDNHIWYSAQYRPIYTQEAVADLNTVVDHIQKLTTIHWEDEWRKGDLKHWNGDLVKHELLDRTGLKTPVALLDQLRIKGREAFQKLSMLENSQRQKEQSAAKLESSASAEQKQQPEASV